MQTESVAASTALIASSPPSLATDAGPGDALLRREYQRLIWRHVEALPELFKKFTGLTAYIAWAANSPGEWNTRELPTQSRLCRQSVAGNRAVLARCRTCIDHHLAMTLGSGHAGHRFTCFLGIHNFWLPIIIRSCIVGLAFIQALAVPGVGAVTCQKPLNPHRTPASAAAARPARAGCRAGKRMGRTEFGEAAKLLHLVFEHVETAALADLRKSDLTRAQRALLEMQTVTTRLRRELNGVVPVFNKASPVLEHARHTEQMVRGALAYIHQHYSHPLTLQQCADRLHLNAAYFSAQFSRAVGIPFKAYLTDVRLEKARELLGDPSATIADVASAVGYASENRFRIAFKTVTGLSPKLWRETLKIEPR